VKANEITKIQRCLRYFCYLILAYAIFYYGLYLYASHQEKQNYKYFCAVLAEEELDCNIAYSNMKQDFFFKYTHMKESEVDTIPLIQHFVHAFGKDEPRVISEYKITKMVRTIEKLNKDDLNWQHYIWTNDSSGIPDSILQLNNVHIKFLEELEDNTLYPDLISDFNSPQLVDWVQGSDIVRIVILKKYGGVYFDCDVEVFRPDELRKLMRSFDLVLGEEQCLYTVGNAIMLATPNHPFINTAIDLIYRNIHQDDFKSTPKYLRENYRDRGNVIVETGPIMTTVAYYIYANSMLKSGVNTRSLVLPPGALYNLQLARKQPPLRKGCEPMFWGIDLNLGNYKGIKIDSIAADPLCGVWKLSIT